MYYKIVIDETGRDCLKDKATMFNRQVETFGSLDAVKDYIKERYGKLPSGKNKVYIDTDKGKTIELGFMYSYWNQDISHMSKKWYQTDWITITEVTEKPVLIN